MVKSCLEHISKLILIGKSLANYLYMYVFYVCILCVYSMYVFYVCMYSVHVLYACILCIPCMYVVHEWTGRTEPFQNYIFLEPNERNPLEILFIWTLARRVRNARNSQEIPFSWTFQFVDAVGICLLQAQPMSKCTEFPKNCVHSTPVWPRSK